MRLTNIESDALACGLERNYIEGFRLLSTINSVAFIENESIVEIYTGYPAAYMNGVLRFNGYAENLDDLISNILKKYLEGVPTMWRVGALSANAGAIGEKLLAQGFSQCTEPGMVLDIKEYTKAEVSSDLSVRLVKTKQDVLDWLIPYTEAFGDDPIVVSHFEKYMSMRLRMTTNEVWFTGYVDNAAVSCSCYLTHDGMTVLYNVGTLKCFRGRGYARRTVDAAIQHAIARFSSPIGLYATEMGFPLYEKMGFREIYRMSCFVKDLK